MSFTHTIRQIYTAGTIAAADKTFTYTGSGEVNVDESCADATTTIISAAVDVSALPSWEMLSDKTVTVNTNSPTDDTVALTANVPVMWSPDLGVNPLGTDVITFRVVNASGGAARFRFRGLVDVTP
jgi:hypothetical protein